MTYLNKCAKLAAIRSVDSESLPEQFNQSSLEVARMSVLCQSFKNVVYFYNCIYCVSNVYDLPDTICIREMG